MLQGCHRLLTDTIMGPEEVRAQDQGMPFPLAKPQRCRAPKNELKNPPAAFPPSFAKEGGSRSVGEIGHLEAAPLWLCAYPRSVSAQPSDKNKPLGPSALQRQHSRREESRSLAAPPQPTDDSTLRISTTQPHPAHETSPAGSRELLSTAVREGKQKGLRSQLAFVTSLHVLQLLKRA